MGVFVDMGRHSSSPSGSRGCARSPPPKSRRKSPSKSKSRSRSYRRPLGAGNAQALGEAIDSIKAEVVEGKPRHNGDVTFQAEVLLTLTTTSMGTAGRPRTMCIRGPVRPDKDQAHKDCDELESAGKDGVKAVRDLAAVMKRSR